MMKATPNPRRLPASDVLIVCCRLLQVGLDDLHGSQRGGAITRGRVMTTGALRRFCGMSFPEIARALGRISHSSVMTWDSRFMRLPNDKRVAWLAAVRAAVEAGDGR